MFQELQICTKAVKPVLYEYRRKAKIGQPIQFQLMYEFIPSIKGEELFEISRVPLVYCLQSWRWQPFYPFWTSKTDQKNKKLTSREGLPQQRFKVADKALVAKEKALGANNKSDFQSNWYGQYRVIGSPQSFPDMDFSQAIQMSLENRSVGP